MLVRAITSKRWRPRPSPTYLRGFAQGANREPSRRQKNRIFSRRCATALRPGERRAELAGRRVAAAQAAVARQSCLFAFAESEKENTALGSVDRLGGAFVIVGAEASVR